MRKRCPCDEVHLADDAATLYHCLDENDDFKALIDGALDLLKEHMFVGQKIKKDRIPKHYLNKYDIKSCYRLKLNHKRRLSYTILIENSRKKTIVLEIFEDHKSYSKRFGYKNH